MGDMLTCFRFFQGIQRGGLIAETGAAMQKHDAEILDLNRTQLDRGELSDGDTLGRYSPATLKRKQKDIAKGVKGIQAYPMNLYQSGDFRKEFTLTIEGNKYTVTSGNDKTPHLIKMFTGAIFGLTPESVGKVWGIVRDDVVGEIKRKQMA